MKSLLLVLAALGFSGLAHADNASVHFMLTGGLTNGGDTFTSASNSNGDTHDMKAGGVIQVGAGVLARLHSLPVDLQATLNYHYNKLDASNGDAEFSRVPIELLGFYRFTDAFRLGMGVRLVNGAKYEQTVNGYSDSVTFDDTTGFVVEGGYSPTKNWTFSLRWVTEEYKKSGYQFNVDGQWKDKIDGSHVGLFANYNF